MDYGKRESCILLIPPTNLCAPCRTLGGLAYMTCPACSVPLSPQKRSKPRKRRTREAV